MSEIHVCAHDQAIRARSANFDEVIKMMAEWTCSNRIQFTYSTFNTAWDALKFARQYGFDKMCEYLIKAFISAASIRKYAKIILTKYNDDVFYEPIFECAKIYVRT